MVRALLFTLLFTACGAPESVSRSSSDAGGTAGAVSSGGQAVAGATAGTSGTVSTSGGSAGQQSTGGAAGASTGGSAGAQSAGGTSSAGAAGEQGDAGAPPMDPVVPSAETTSPCDPDGPGGVPTGWPVRWTVPAGWCLTWSNAEARNEPDDPDLPNVCSYFDHDPGTGRTVSYSCGVLTVYPGEPDRAVRLESSAAPTYYEINESTGWVCPGPTGTGACGVTSDAYDVREQCLASCFNAMCCKIASSAATVCNGQPVCY